MKEIAQELESQIEDWDATQVIKNEKIEIHFFPDDRGFGYITCKLFDESLFPLLQKYQSQYEGK